MADHLLMGGHLHVYKRPNSRYWQCSTFLAGKNRRVSTHEESLEQARDFAEDWYIGLKAKHRYGELRNEKTFRQAAEKFQREYPIITEGNRNAQYVDDHRRRLELYLLPFFGDMGLSRVTAGHFRSTASGGASRRWVSAASRRRATLCIRRSLRCARC